MEIRVNHIVFGYDSGHNVLNDVNFEIKENEMVAIVGTSGCGKTTLLKIISGLIKKTRTNNFIGDVQHIYNGKQQAFIPGSLAFMFQEPSLFPNLNVYENVKLPLELCEQEFDRSYYENISDLIEMVGLQEYNNRHINELSGGMKTRVALARSFVTKPKVVLLDEPFGNLDIGWKFELYNKLIKLKNSNKSLIIIVTHDILEAVLLAKKIYILSKRGKILKCEKSNIELPNNYDQTTVNDFIFKVNSFYLEIQRAIITDGLMD
jgi:NitT/TauT family transport system ATP-binding protein